MTDSLMDTSAEPEANTETAATTETSTEEAAAAKYYLSEGVAGEGDAPEWFKGEKYKNVSEQAKGYKELEKRFGSFTGAPKEYELNLSEDMVNAGVEIADDDYMLADAKVFAKEAGLNQEGFDKMVGLYVKNQLTDQMAQADYKTDQIKALGSDGPDRINNVSLWAEANMEGETMEQFKASMVSADAIQIAEWFIGREQNASVSPSDATTLSGKSETEIKDMQFAKDEYGGRKIATDPAFRAEYEKARDAFYGNTRRANIG